jgi:F0F1-type ATP synthase assembly protein I
MASNGQSIVTFETAPDKQRLRRTLQRPMLLHADLAGDGWLDHTCSDTAMGTLFTKNSGEAFRAAGALSSVGLAFVLALVMGFWFGSVLDRWFGTKPVLTIVFFFLGLAAGILNVYRIVAQAYPAGTSGAASAAPQAPPPAGSNASDGLDDRDLHDDQQ